MSKTLARLEHSTLQYMMTIGGSSAAAWVGSSMRSEMLLYQMMNDIVTSSRLEPCASSSEEHKRAGLFPVMNPLRLSAQLQILSDIPREMRLVDESYRDTSFSAAHIERDSLLGDFKRMTGRSPQAYIKAYERSSNSYFGKFTKLLKKSDMTTRPHENIIDYLAHPLFRYDAVQQYLHGKNLPILEFDILREWAARRGIEVGDVSQISTSLVSEADGQRGEDGNIVSTSPDGKLLNRQQVLDTYRNLLPHVLQALVDVDISEGPGRMDISEAWDAMSALFAVASLNRDTSILGMADALCPPFMSAFRFMQLVPESLGIGTHRFNIEHLNNGFCPSTLELITTVMEAPGVQGAGSAAAKHRNVLLPEIYTHLSGIGAILASPANLIAGYGGADYFADDESVIHESGYDVQGLLDSAQAAWNELRSGRLYTLKRQQANYALIEAMQSLSRDDIGVEDSVLGSVMPDDGETVSLLNIEVFQRVAKKYLVTPETKSDLENRVFPALDRMITRARWVQEVHGFSADETGALTIEEPEVECLVLPEPVADAFARQSLSTRSDTELDEVAHHALSLGHNLRALNLTFIQGAISLHATAVKHQKAVQEAFSAQGGAAEGEEGAFMAIETQMQAVDEARERYRVWAKEAVIEMMEVLEEQDEFLKQRLVTVLLFEETGSVDKTDAESGEAPAEASDELLLALKNMDKEVAELSSQIDAQKAASEDEVSRLVASHSEEVAALEQELSKRQADVDQAQYQAKALKNHLAQATFGKPDETSTGFHESLTQALIAYAESPRPVTAIRIAERMFPERLVVLDSAVESAADAVEMNGGNLLRRLLILATEGWDIWQEGRPLYALNDVMPGDVALSESDTNLNMPKLRQQRTFKESLGDGRVQEWVMESHNWIDWQHRLYFNVDDERGVFVIGYAGRHLGISSAS